MNDDHHLAPLGPRLIALVADTGLADLVGGADALQAGMEDLLSGLAQVSVDVLRAEHDGTGLAEASFDPARYPHFAAFHGFLFDLVMHRVPGPMVAWAERIVDAGPAQDAPEIRRALVACALTDELPIRRALARVALYEISCVNQRLLLRSSGFRLEALGGSRTDVEVLAEASVLAALEEDDGIPDLLDCEDPSEVLVAASIAGLARHVDLLKDELITTDRLVRDELQERRELLEIFDALPVEDAVLAYNGVGLEGPHEERLEIDDLRRLHPLVLGEVSNDAAYKRLERLPDKAARIRTERVTLRKDTSLADLILRAAARGGE